ncbi:hypothetical protein FRC12_012221 [Ceratobasidium sp. 428]|nr:hypothetical protein FRC12_012221 [Ceratobasidium sp. 428]
MSGAPIDKLSPVRRVLAIPELFRLICGILGNKAVKLIYLSRDMFPGAASVIWQDVDIQHLLALIPGTKRTNETPDRKLYPICVFDLPSEINLQRFELYARFVRRLYTLGPCTINFPPHWMQSKQEIAAMPLLPNLLHLDIHHRTSIRREELEWSSMFIGPRLLRFETHGTSFERRPQTEEETIIGLVTKMSEVCSRLETLSVPCRKDLSLPILDFHNLRAFSINECGISDELLHTLSRLPYLEKLSVLQEMLDPPRETCKQPIELSDESFPSLRRLVLNYISPFLIARFCTSTKLFHKLVSASILFGFDNNNVSMDSVQRLNTAVFSLGRNSPHITNLAISLTCWFVPTWSIIDSFKHMPLISLDLCLVPLESEYYIVHQTEPDFPPIGWRDFLAAVPLLEELKLNAQTFKSSELPIFATLLPHLRLLKFDGIECSGTEEVLPIVGWRPATQPITIRVGVFSIKASRSSSTSNVARYFHYLWPNVTFKTGEGSAKALVAKLNRAIKSLKAEEFRVEINA